MKTYGHIFEDAFSFKALMHAYKRARRGKRYRYTALVFAENLEENILALRDELHTGTYEHGAYRQFIVHDAKKRHIQAAPFRDRAVHQAVYAALEPFFERSFIFDNYACRVGKGSLAAIDRFERYIKSSKYVLACDISKYFASINHTTLKQLLARRIRDQRMLRVCEIIIDSNNAEAGKGIPIGNLTSQLFANVYLNELDQFAKHTLRAPQYIRYMDDFVLLSNDKAFLHHAREHIEAFLADKLQLVLHPKKVQIVPVRTGIDYLGYRIFPHYRKLRKQTVKRFVARTKREKLRGGGYLWKEYFRGACMRAVPDRGACASQYGSDTAFPFIINNLM